MPRPDPLPDPQAGPPADPRLATMRQFRRLMKWLALFSIVVALVAVLLVAQGDDGIHVHMLIATALGAGLSVLLAGALMSLAFLSARGGHDEPAARAEEDEDK